MAADEDGDGDEHRLDHADVGAETVAIVLNETLVVSDQRNGEPVSAAVRWSLLRSVADEQSLVTVTMTEADPNLSVVATDVRLELLGDDLYNRLTRGVEVVLHDYEVLAGPAELLRNSAGQALVAEISGQAITWPLR